MTVLDVTKACLICLSTYNLKSLLTTSQAKYMWQSWTCLRILLYLNQDVGEGAENDGKHRL